MAGKAAASTPATPKVGVEEAEDSKTERWLQRYGVKYAPKTKLALGLIDEKRSRGNQARDKAIVPELVERYSLALKHGEYLGAIVVYVDGNRAVIIDGNNREAAHRKNGEQFIWAYVVDSATPSETIHRLTVSANVRHGGTPDSRWRIKQAAFLVSIGVAQDDAARDAEVSVSQLRDYQAALRAEARAKGMKIHDFEKQSLTAKKDLGRLTNDPVFYQAAHAAIETGMTAEEVRTFVRDVKALKSDNEQIAHIVAVAERRKLERRENERPGKKARVSSPKTSLVTSLGKIQAIDPADLARQALTDLDRQLLIHRIEEGGEKLIELQVALETASKEAHRDAS
jgi:hypothetical protein